MEKCKIDKKRNEWQKSHKGAVEVYRKIVASSRVLFFLTLK